MLYLFNNTTRQSILGSVCLTNYAKRAREISERQLREIWENSLMIWVRKVKIECFYSKYSQSHRQTDIATPWTSDGAKNTCFMFCKQQRYKEFCLLHIFFDFSMTLIFISIDLRCMWWVHFSSMSFSDSMSLILNYYACDFKLPGGFV